MTVVVYLMDKTFHATRHAEDCGVLRRARINAEQGESGHGRFTVHHLFGDQQYDLLVKFNNYIEAKDHSCVEAEAIAAGLPGLEPPAKPRRGRRR